MTIEVYLTAQQKDKLVQNWGPEVILRCACRDWPSHSMFGQRTPGTCALCRSACEVIVQDWSNVDG